jgi:EAL domain-containing protein (putative c-di-GMP-specific phosphodiesterase class I)/GGDEF domain-containing protein/integral membrane sensor domain MASE1
MSEWNAVRYGTIVVWPANGVALAALLQLHRREAIRVLAIGFLLNLGANILRGNVPYMVVLFAALNYGEILAGGLLARRFCGAALDLRRPIRLARFILIAASVAFAGAAIGLAAFPTPLESVIVSLQTWFTVDALSLVLVTPPLLLLARAGRFAAEDERPLWEKIGLVSLLVAVTAGVFAQAAAPVLFLVFLPLLLIALRLSPSWAAFSVLIVAFIGGTATLNGYGPITLSHVGPSKWDDPNLLPVLRRLPIFQLFTTAVLFVALTASTILTERRRLEARLKARTAAAVTARAAAEAARRRIAHLALHDLETDLPNLAGLKEALFSGIGGEPSTRLFVAALGIDRFAAIRGAIGSTQAAQLVGRTAQLIGERLPEAHVARLSADTIGIAFGAKTRDRATEQIAIATSALSEPVEIGADLVDVRVSVGLAEFLDPAEDAGRLIECALIALDQARAGQRRICSFDADAERVAGGGLTLLSELRASLDTGAVFLAHQPKLDLRTGRIAGFECLIRWTHPERGPISPENFMPLVEETGFMEPLTDWVLRQALKDSAALSDRGIDLGIAINLSARSLSEPGLAARLAAIVANCGGGAARLTLEITETAIMSDPQVAFANIAALRDAGFKIAIDDYGTGLSSLAYLRQISADSLKIDRSFVTGLGRNKRDAELVRSTIELGHRLGLEVVAEGVETRATLDVLTLLGCDQAQGYLIGVPLRADAIDTETMANWSLAGESIGLRKRARAR